MVATARTAAARRPCCALLLESDGRTARSVDAFVDPGVSGKCPPPKVPLPVGGSGDTTRAAARWHLDRLVRFCRAHICDQHRQTDRQTAEHPDMRIGIALRAAMRPNKSLPSCWW